MIYHYLYVTAGLVIGQSFFKTEYVSEIYSVASRLWNPEVVGKDVLREFCEHFYRSNTFNLDNNFLVIPGFRISDRWNTGCTPAEFPTNVHFNIYKDSYDFQKMRKGGPNYENSYYGHDEWFNAGWESRECTHKWPGRKSRPELLAELDMVLGFAEGVRVTLNIISRYYGLDSDDDQMVGLEATFNLLLPLMLPLLSRMRASGLLVCVIVKDGGDHSLESAKAALRKVNSSASTESEA